jgi:asparagine synthase (glutamine-hydrolysing)
MCGICGLVMEDVEAIEPLVRQMMRSMLHRGPDDEGYEPIVLGQGIAEVRGGLGFRRLSILDLSTAGHQPMVHPRTGDCLVFNGEIYNFASLRRELEQHGETFRGASDTEVLLSALVRWGEGVLERLDGMFAFAWYQARWRRLILARDRSGIKPLYWVAAGRKFAFASEIKSLQLLPWLDRRIDYKALLGHISTLFAPRDATMFAAVRKLEPGQLLMIEEDCIPRVSRFTPVPYSIPPDIDDARQAANECRLVLGDAVQRQLVADVPVGGFLSGGIDSSAIAYFATNSGQRSTVYPVFTIRLGDLKQRGEGFSEDLPHASLVARTFGMPLHVVTASPDLRTQTDRMVWQLDEPIGDPAALNVWYLSEAARAAGVTVLLSGAGADDIFTGYRRHTALKFSALWRRTPAGLRSILERTSLRLSRGTSLGRRLTRLWRDTGRSANDRMLGYFLWLDSQRVRSLLAPDVLMSIGDWSPEAALARTLAELPPTTDPLNRMLYLEQRHFLADHNLTYTDKMSMAHGIEVRVPFLSPAVLRFTERLTPRVKHRGIAGKSVLRDAMQGLLPKAILTRSKTGFGIGLRGIVATLAKERLLAEHKSGVMQFMRREAVAELIAAHESRRLDAAYPLYAMICTDSWIRQFRATG